MVSFYIQFIESVVHVSTWHQRYTDVSRCTSTRVIVCVFTATTTCRVSLVWWVCSRKKTAATTMMLDGHMMTRLWPMWPTWPMLMTMMVVHRLVCQCCQTFTSLCPGLCLHHTHTMLLSVWCNTLHRREYKITCSMCLCVRTHGFWRLNISKTAEDRGSVAMWHQYEMAHGESIWSRDRWCNVTLKAQGRDPNMLVTHYLQKWLAIQTRVQWSTYRKWHLGYKMVTWPVMSRDPERSRWWPRYIWMEISWIALDIALDRLCVPWTLSCWQ